MRIFGGLLGDMVESVTEPIEDLFTDNTSTTNKNKKPKCNQVNKELNYSFNDIMDLIIDSPVDAETKLVVLICFLKGTELARLTYGKDTYNRTKKRLKIKE